MIQADRAYAELRARILDLRLRPGQVVPELPLAAALGMGRLTIHDALVRLQAEGLVEALPRRGFAVAVPTAAALAEIYEVVGALEGQCVRQMTRDGGAIMLAALQASVEAQEAALTQDDADSWGEADRRFHELLREGTANQRLRGLFRQFAGQLQQARAATIHLRPKPHRSTDDHRAILAAIRSRDEDEAVRVHQAHRRRADAEMLAALAQYAQPGPMLPPERDPTRASLVEGDGTQSPSPAPDTSPTSLPTGTPTRP
jgi:DNA-binding GntR family transcriptional regulator